ncbi:hypothetical protein DIPPA_09026 [Diplonema papillatum]|nr:hypothetical protein DIPPA_09026 [Diplonema papillatum]
MPPPMPPTPLGFALNPSSSGRVVVDLFADLSCPFSRKVLALWASGGDAAFFKDHADVKFVMHSVPQPWHPQSCMMHECLHAVDTLDPTKTWSYIVEFLKSPEKFSDVHTKDMSRHQIYEAAAEVAVAAGLVKKEFLDLLLIYDDACNRVTQRLKWAVKFHRARGVHVTPTVHINGLEAGDVSSSWGKSEWEAKLTNL